MQIVVLLTLIAVVFMASAQNAEDIVYTHPLTDMPPSAEDVETSPYFPEHPDHKLPTGNVVTALCHFTNDGPSHYNVSAIMGSLNSPLEFNHHFQNYSYMTIGTVVKPGEEITLKYSFELHKELEPVDYQLAITVFYESDQESFSTTFFNQTVELYSPTSEYDLEALSAVLFGLACVVGIVLITVFACFPDQRIPIVSDLFAKVNQLEKNNIRTLSTKSDPDDEWLVDQPAATRKGKKGSKAE